MNFIFGAYPYGQYPFIANIQRASGDEERSTTILSPNVFSIKCYDEEGLKVAEYNSSASEGDILNLNFEIQTTGCGAFSIIFGKLPDPDHFGYNRRIDIHLFNDSRPWYSGFVQTLPIRGSTNEKFTVSGFGFYDLLGRVLISGVYENMDVADIVNAIGKKVENLTGIRSNSAEIHKTDYKVTRIVFDGETAKDAIQQLVEFSADFIAGVDERKRLFFVKKVSKINEEGRFWVGPHIFGKYEPEEDVAEIVNFARIKGGKLDNEGTNWLAVVEDSESQARYGRRERVLSLPSAFSEADAARWGYEQLKIFKDPIQNAKVSGIQLEYPNADGSFGVRKLTTRGRVAIYTREGESHYYPLEKIKYEITADKGIYCSLTLGKSKVGVSGWLARIEQNAKNQEFLQNSNNKQLRGGSF